jgi:hypothetical protein
MSKSLANDCKSPTMDGVVFFNNKNTLTVKMRGSRKDCPLDLSPFRERLNTCAVYLDDEHTVVGCFGFK